ncbi:MAG: histidine triad nucleotide-binding protein [bacterium]|nr:histidine triad nucleotide-binding protein [bacterium]
MDCIFCKIIQKEIPADFLFEDSEHIAMNDIRPSAPVHILILPKAHIESIIQIEDKDKEIVSKLIYTAKDLAKKRNLTGYKLVFNVGKDGGQVIPHLHLHLLGGWIDKKSIESMSHKILDK